MPNRLVHAVGLIGCCAWFVAAPVAVAQGSGSPAQPRVAASVPSSWNEETVIRYDEECLRQEVRECMRPGGVLEKVPRYPASGPVNCGGGRFLPRWGGDDKPCVISPSAETMEALRLCEMEVRLLSPERCQRRELTAAGWRAMLRAEFSAIAEELKRACLAVGKTEAECARSPLALPTPPSSPSR